MTSWWIYKTTNQKIFIKNIFWKNKKRVIMNYHAKSRAFSLKIDWVMLKLVFGGHFVFWRPFCFLLRFYSLQIERVMLNFILWRPFYLLVAILLFGGHFIFDFWLRVVKIYFHAKLQASSLKIEVFGSLFFWRPFYFL